MHTNIKNQFKTPLSFNDFEVLKEIGSGYFASVYRVRYKIDGQIYAIKRYDKSKDKKESELDYYREKAILYDLDKRGYPSIVKLYADFEDNVSRNLVMECVEGITLQKKRGNMNGYVPQNEVINILTQLLETLQFLHEKCNIIHRDIKPSNIIIQKDNKIKLLDFGISVYMENLDQNLVSKKSVRGELNYVAPEILMKFYGSPTDYDYKMDIFSLGFTMYSFMNPTNNEDEVNLPQITIKNKGSHERQDLFIQNNFYEPWLIDFVELLYDNDQMIRPSAADALKLLKKFQTNPQTTYLFNKLKYNNRQENVKNINLIFRRMDSNAVNSMSNVAPISNPMVNSAQQMNNMFNTNMPSINLHRINSVEIQKKNRMEPIFLNNNMGKENRVISSMKSLLQVLYHLDNMNYIKAQILSLFSNTKIDYSPFFIHYFYQILNNVQPANCGQLINQVNYTQYINQFIQRVFIKNKSGISGTRPIILFYMITSIIRDDFLNIPYFNGYQNNIFDYMIQSNFSILNNLIPMTNPLVYNSVSQAIYNFKNNYKGHFVDNFYFFILSVSTCPNCNNLFGVRTQLSQFLQLEVKNPQNNISDLVSYYFCPKLGYGNYNCQNCGLKGQKTKKIYCLNLPNYLILEFEDKNAVNFSDNIFVPLFNGNNITYQFSSCIYKIKKNDISDFVAVFKIGNNYYFYSDDKIEQCPKEYINLQCPSLAIYIKK